LDSWFLYIWVSLSLLKGLEFTYWHTGKGFLRLLKDHMASFPLFSRLWLQMYQADTRRKILSYERQYRTSAERMAELRLQEDLHILKDAQVIGMTTTGKKV
jgi:hypothetical protein